MLLLFGPESLVYLRGIGSARSHDHVHGGLEYVSKTWLGEELESESLSTLVVVVEEAVPRVLSDSVKDRSEVIVARHVCNLMTTKLRELMQLR